MRKVEHIIEGDKKKGLSTDEAESRAWGTVNKQDGGGTKRVSGRKRTNSARSTSSVSAKGSATKGTLRTRIHADDTKGK